MDKAARGRKYRKRVSEVNAVQVTTENAYPLAVEHDLYFLRLPGNIVRMSRKPIGSTALNDAIRIGDWLLTGPDGVTSMTDEDFCTEYEEAASA